MRKVISVLLLCTILLGNIAAADTKTIDLEQMTVEELDELIEEVENEKKIATEVSRKEKDKLESDFMRTVEALFPEGTKFSYPFFGLSIVHRRNYYCVCGTVGCKLPDKTKQDLWDATIIYWYDENAKTFQQAAFYTKDKVYSYDEYALQQVEQNLESVARENLRKHKISIKPTGTPFVLTYTPVPTDAISPTSVPTAIPITTPTETPLVTSILVSTPTPTPESVPTATLSKQGSFSFGSTKRKDDSEASDPTENEDTAPDVINETTDDTYSSMFKSIASGGTVLNLHEVLQNVPSEFNPSNYDHMYVYYFTLQEGIEKGTISEDQGATLADYMAQIVGLFEKKCYGFQRKVARKGHEELVFSFSAGLVFYSTSSVYDHERYGTISVDNDSRIRVDWNDGGVEWFYFAKNNDGEIQLLDSDKAKTKYTNVELKEVPMYLILGCVNAYLAKPKFISASNSRIANVGDIVQFGHYPQNIEDDDNSPIEWVVIKKEKNILTLLSRKVLEIMPFNKIVVNGNWEKSNLRKWLNNDFKTKAFSKNELEAIVLITRENVKDTVSLLSLQEVKTVFDSSSSTYKQHEDINKYSVAPYTAYAIKQQSEISSAIREASDSELLKEKDWWTCSVDSTDRRKVFCIHGSQSFFTQRTEFCDVKSIGVRPIIQIDPTKAEYAIQE